MKGACRLAHLRADPKGHLVIVGVEPKGRASMNKFLPLSLCCGLTTLAVAQTQILRGKVEDVPNTTNQFFLDGTNLPLTSAALNLNTILGQQMVLTVVNTGTATAPVLDVSTALATTKVFDMGNLRVGRSDTWQVNALAGSIAFVFVDLIGSTGYHPFGQYGTFLLGSNAITLATGFTNGLSQFEFTFAVPASAAPFVGTVFTGQALVGDHGTWFFSNPDSKTVQAQ